MLNKEMNHEKDSDRFIRAGFGSGIFSGRRSLSPMRSDNTYRRNRCVPIDDKRSVHELHDLSLLLLLSMSSHMLSDDVLSSHDLLSYADVLSDNELLVWANDETQV